MDKVSACTVLPVNYTVADKWYQNEWNMHKLQKASSSNSTIPKQRIGYWSTGKWLAGVYTVYELLNISQVSEIKLAAIL